MRSSLFLGLCCSIAAVQCYLSDRLKEDYNEHLKLSNLADGKLLAHFEFTTEVKASTKPNAPCKSPKCDAPFLSINSQ